MNKSKENTLIYMHVYIYVYKQIIIQVTGQTLIGQTSACLKVFTKAPSALHLLMLAEIYLESK